MKALLSKRLLSFSAMPVLVGCMMTPPTEVPMASITALGESPPNDSLIIMLPGRGDRANAFIKAGFLDASGQRNFDTIAVDAHLGYYNERTLVQRLHEDIVLPARMRGYRNIWILGISMGGVGSLLYAQEHPNQISGIILIAPYLGNARLAGEIEAAGGLELWSGTANGYQDYEIAIWRFLQNATNRADPVPIILGYGLEDRLAATYGPLNRAIDPSFVYTLDGGHKWTTWIRIWGRVAADLEM